jgi:FkbM family methyltransferase
MLHWSFTQLLRLPNCRGKARLVSSLRKWIYGHRTQQIIHGLTIGLDPLEWAQLDLMRDGRQEPLTTALFGRLLREGDVYVDVGAHIGYHTLIARHHIGKSGIVIAIDPQPYNCDRVLTNWQLNGFTNIRVQVAAAGSGPGYVHLRHQSPHDRTRLSLVEASVQDEEPAAPSLSFAVPVIGLADLLEQHGIGGPVKLLKIDVEGFEESVLDGLQAAAKHVENVIVEVLPATNLRRGESLPLLDWLKSHGFSMWRNVAGVTWQPGDRLPENNLWSSRPALKGSGLEA